MHSVYKHTHAHTHTPCIYVCAHTNHKCNFIFGIDLVLTSVNQFIEWDEFNACINRKQVSFSLIL